MASERRSVALVGAGSLLGREILLLLEDERRRVPIVRAFSERASGATIDWRGDALTVEPLDANAFADPTLALALFCTGRDRSRRFVPRALERGLAVVDASADRRLEPKVPLLGEFASEPPRGSRVLSLPGAPAWMAARLLAPLLPFGLLRLDATLIAPVSGRGAAGVRELSEQTRALLGARPARSKGSPHRVAFNVVPEVAGLVDGEDRTEVAFRGELRRLLGLPGLGVSVTAVRAPVFFGLGASFSIATARPLTPAVARRLWEGATGVKVLDDPGRHVYPMPSLAAGTPEVLVGRIRSGAGSEGGDGAAGSEVAELGRLAFFAAVDGLRLVAEGAVAATLRLLA